MKAKNKWTRRLKFKKNSMYDPALYLLYMVHFLFFPFFSLFCFWECVHMIVWKRLVTRCCVCLYVDMPTTSWQVYILSAKSLASGVQKTKVSFVIKESEGNEVHLFLQIILENSGWESQVSPYSANCSARSRLSCGPRSGFLAWETFTAPERRERNKIVFMLLPHSINLSSDLIFASIWNESRKSCWNVLD